MLKISDLERSFSHIKLPSKGEFYENGCHTVKLYHLNGNDLSILTDRTLIADGSMIDSLLKSKVVKADTLDVFVPPEKMLIGDRYALLIQLRIHLNRMYRIMVFDPETNKPFETDFDLTTLKTKDIDILPDENKLFNFTFEKSYSTPINAKFRLMIGEDEKILRQFQSSNRYKESEYTLLKLKQLCVSIDGNDDPIFIEHFLKVANLEDVTKFNSFITKVSSGIDMNISVISEGGKSINTFLSYGHDFFTP